jgi:hypothetical protein
VVLAGSKLRVTDARENDLPASAGRPAEEEAHLAHIGERADDVGERRIAQNRSTRTAILASEAVIALSNRTGHRIPCQGLKKGLRGRFGMYVPPVMKALGLAEVEDLPRNNHPLAVPRRLLPEG